MHPLFWGVMLFLPIPLIQYAAGMIPFVGSAWMSTAYIFGFLLSLVIGARWERIAPGQVGVFIFIAVSIAAIISVGLEMHQWLRFDTLEIWVMRIGESGRPFANMGQPNQLATLLLWSLLACAWALESGTVRPSIVILVALYVLFGVALTESRTAWLGLAFLMVAAWKWKNLSSHKFMPWVVTGLALFFVLVVLNLQLLNDVLLLDRSTSFVTRTAGEKRLSIYLLFAENAIQKPFFGYGWNQSRLAHLASRSDEPFLDDLYDYSHNLFLDLILWSGIPLGLLASFGILYFVFRIFKKINDLKGALLALFVALIGIHAMLELPLYYAYFLLPTGLVLGALCHRYDFGGGISIHRRLIISLISLSFLFLVLVVKDYFEIESNFQAFQFERARIGTLPKREAPDVIVITQLRDFLKFARMDPRKGVGDVELQWMIDVTNTYPSPANMLNLIEFLVLNDKLNEAQKWMMRAQRVSSENQYKIIKTIWENKAKTNPVYNSVLWVK